MLQKITLYFCLFILSCAGTKSSNDASDNVMLKINSHQINGNNILLNVEVVNESKNSVSILKPRPQAKLGSWGPPSPVFPDFFKVSLPNQANPCLELPPGDASKIGYKSLNDILTVAPKSNAVFQIKCNEYSSFYCKEDQLEVVVKYNFDKRYLERDFFDRRMSDLSEPERTEFYNALLNMYQLPLSASIVVP